MIQAILADDEVLARQKLRQLLRAEPDVEIVGECATARETVELTRAAKPHLLFLDIRMPGMDGFDIIGALEQDKGVTMPGIIFTTAYDQYALRAFEVHALDYLLKPFTPERLRVAIQRVRERPSAEAPSDAAHPRNGRSAGHTARMVFKSRGRILFLPVSEIRWIGAEENYVRLAAGNETHLLRETMTHLEQRLDPRQFLRVHRSFMVNLNYVKEVRTETEGEAAVIMQDGQRIALSRNFKSRVLDRFHR
jgi:two-component system, LytTR family, response regulator